MYGDKRVSVVLPAYNEELHIRTAVGDFFVPGIVDEVIVVDNNSRDRTAEEAAMTPARIVSGVQRRVTATRFAADCGKRPATS